MGMFDTLTGKSAIGSAGKANTAFQTGVGNASNVVNTGADTARNTLYDLAGLARGAFDGGANEAASHLTKGYGDAKDVYGGYFGQGVGAVGTGFQSAIDTNKGAMDGVKAAYQPYSAAGTGAQDLYSAFLGLKGADAQRTAQGTFSDPYGRAIEDRTVAALNRQANAGGFIGSGRSSLAASRAVGEGAYGRQMDYLRMLQEQAGRGQAGELQFGQMGLQNAGNIGQLYANQGATLGNMYGNAARDIAGYNIAGGKDQGNNMQQWAANQAKNYTDLSARQAEVEGTRAKTLADLIMGGAKVSADSELAVGAAKKGALDNYINIGSKIASAAMGMPPIGSPSNSGSSSSTLADSGSYYTPQQMQQMNGYF